MTVVPGLVLGIDGGGTKTSAWLATWNPSASAPPASSMISPVSGAAAGEGRPIVIGCGQAGPSNQRAVGQEVALRNLDQAVSAAFENAQLPRQTVLCACLGLAGADRASDRSVIEHWAKDCQLARQVVVVNDAVPLLYADEEPSATSGFGIALICGTGSLAFGRGHDGQTARSGGWGYLLGDEGSAFAIGQCGLRSAAQSADGRGPQTMLLKSILDRLVIESPEELVQAVYGAKDPRSQIAGLADLVFAAATQHDPCAVRILTDARSELSKMVVTLAHRLGLAYSLPLFLTGGIVLNQPDFRQQLQDEITSQGIELCSVNLVPDPVAGAVRMAVQSLRELTATDPDSEF